MGACIQQAHHMASTHLRTHGMSLTTQYSNMHNTEEDGSTRSQRYLSNNETIINHIVLLTLLAMSPSPSFPQEQFSETLAKFLEDARQGEPVLPFHLSKFLNSLNLVIGVQCFYLFMFRKDKTVSFCWQRKCIISREKTTHNLGKEWNFSHETYTDI